jgi:antitoxin PrlF
MTTSTLTRKNQTTIPKSVVNALGLKPSTLLVYDVRENGEVILTAKTATFASLAGTFPKKPRKPARTEEEMKSAIRKQSAARFLRAKA